jgi:hypothetical protein
MASVSSQFAIVSITEDDFEPVLIDFGGPSFYHCEAADSRAATSDDGHKTRVSLFQKVMALDANQLRCAFELFVARGRQRLLRAAATFRMWKVLTKFQVLRRQQFLRRFVTAVHWWCDQSVGNICKARTAKIVRRRFFIHMC